MEPSLVGSLTEKDTDVSTYEVVVELMVVRTIAVQASSIEGADDMAKDKAVALVDGYNPHVRSMKLIVEGTDDTTGKD